MNTTETADTSRLTEDEYLDAQLAEAQRAFQKTWGELKSTLRETATLEVWAQRHPWLVAGSAVTGGFLLASILFSPKHEQSSDIAPVADQNGRHNAVPTTRGSSWLVNTLFSLIKPVLGQLVSSLIAGVTGAVGASMANAADQPHTQWPTSDGDGSPAGQGPVPA